LIDANLRDGLIKQRVPRSGQGRSGGWRTIIAYRSGKRAVFLYGFAKNRQANVGKADERDLRDFGALVLGLDEAGIARMIAGGELKEVTGHGED
jgi:hypothetical protein